MDFYPSTQKELPQPPSFQTQLSVKPRLASLVDARHKLSKMLYLKILHQTLASGH